MLLNSAAESGEPPLEEPAVGQFDKNAEPTHQLHIGHANGKRSLAAESRAAEAVHNNLPTQPLLHGVLSELEVLLLRTVSNPRTLRPGHF